MSDKLPIKAPKTAIDSFLDEFNLPKLLVGKAGDAISRLIGAVVDIPAAWIEGKSQSIRDTTEAKSTVTRAIAEKTADIAVSDPELLERAKVAFVSDILRKQENKEAVAKIAIENIGKKEIEDDAQPIDEDWMNVFSRYAEDAGSENLRDLWGKILAGEVRKTGSFSPRTLRFVSELDRKTALEFEKILTFVSNGIFIFKDTKLQQAPWHRIFLSMVDAGLLSDINFVSMIPRTIDPNGLLVYDYLNFSILVNGKVGANIRLQATMLTNVGQELAKIIEASSDVEHIERVATMIPKNDLTEISICSSRFFDGRSKLSRKPYKTIWKSSSG